MALSGVERTPARHKIRRMPKNVRTLPAVLLLLASTPAVAITAEEVVAKNVQARGGATALASLRSLRRTGKFVLPGRNLLISVSDVRERPGRIRQEATYQGLTQIQAFDGARGWQVQPFEGRKDPALMSEDDVKPFRLAADLDGPFVNAKAKGHVLEYLGTEDVDGTLAHKVRVRLKWGGDVTVFFDPDTWMVIRDVQTSTVRGAEQEVETDYGDYEKVGGVYVPMSEESGARYSPPASRGKSIYDKADANVAIASDAFAFPAKAAPAGAGR
jgi:hypothetical protein